MVSPDCETALKGKVPTEQKHCLSSPCSEVAMATGHVSCQGSLRLATLERGPLGGSLVGLGIRFLGSNPGFVVLDM